MNNFPYMFCMLLDEGIIDDSPEKIDEACKKAEEIEKKIEEKKEEK